MRWAPIFKDYLVSTFGSRGLLNCVLRGNPTFPNEIDNPLLPGCYYGESGSLISEIEARLPHDGPIYKNDNGSVYMKIEEAVRRTSVESTIKPFSRHKDERGAFQALITNHATTGKPTMI